MGFWLGTWMLKAIRELDIGFKLILLCPSMGNLMRNRTFSKGFTLIAGVLAAVVILLSQSFYQQAQDNLKKVKTEQTDSQSQDKVIISAPADAVPGSGIIQMDENIPVLVKSIPSDKEDKAVTPQAAKVFTSFYRILFRAIISPNAP